MTNSKNLRIAVHKFTSDDGCQLAFLNAGKMLLELRKFADFVHFVQAGVVDYSAKADIAFIEGSISTPEEKERIQLVRANSKYVITIGACATAGGIQALRNFSNHEKWMANIYAEPKFIKTLSTSTPISAHIKVDLEVWGCPVNTEQVMDVIRSIAFGVMPAVSQDSVCLECKRKGNVCVLVAKQLPCMGPVTQMGCGALCPSVGRACYACYGPFENPNAQSLASWFKNLGLTDEAIGRQFLHINNQAAIFKRTGSYFKGIRIEHDRAPEK